MINIWSISLLTPVNQCGVYDCYHFLLSLSSSLSVCMTFLPEDYVHSRGGWGSLIDWRIHVKTLFGVYVSPSTLTRLSRISNTFKEPKGGGESSGGFTRELLQYIRTSGWFNGVVGYGRRNTLPVLRISKTNDYSHSMTDYYCQFSTWQNVKYSVGELALNKKGCSVNVLLTFDLWDLFDVVILLDLSLILNLCISTKKSGFTGVWPGNLAWV